MRIYRSNGECENRPKDVDFGWWLCEFLEEPQEKTIIIKHEPKIKVYPVESVQKSPLLPEGVFCDNKLTSIVQPTNQQLTTLINTNTLEGKLLLSVINHAKYKSILKDLQFDRFGDCKNSLSLMYEWSLAESSYPSEAFISETTKSSKSISNETCNIPWADAPKAEKTKKDPLLFRCNHRMGVDVDKSLQNFSDRTYEIQSEVYEIRKCFQEEDERIARLTKEAIKLQRDIKETKYLDELLHLLDGRLDKIKSKRWPFRVGFNQRPKMEQRQHQNLII